MRLELRAASVNALVDRADAETLAIVSDFKLRSARQVREPTVGEPDLLELAQALSVNLFERAAFHFALNLHDLT